MTKPMEIYDAPQIGLHLRDHCVDFPKPLHLHRQGPPRSLVMLTVLAVFYSSWQGRRYLGDCRVLFLKMVNGCGPSVPVGNAHYRI